MKVIVDTSVWSLYFRRKKAPECTEIDAFHDLVSEGRAVLLGVVKQELLSGIKENVRFEKLLGAFSGFEPLLANDNDHILAARFFNQCRTKGIQGSFIDYLICAQAVNGKMSILTTDQDFQNYSDCLGLQIWKNRAG